jgi:hypothetical protein
LANINFIVKNDIELKGNLIFEGATSDAFETTLTITDPTADRTITFPDSSGTISLTSHNHTLNSLSNVVITSATDGQALVWDTTTSKWINETISAGDAFPTQTGNNGKFLQTNGSTVSWANVDLSSYAPLASPTFTGTVTIPAGASISGFALLASPTFTGTVTIPAGASISGYATETYVGTAISNLIDAAPGTLDTLNEIAAALGDDPNFASTITTSIGTKAPISSTTFTGTATIPTLNLTNALGYAYGGTGLTTLGTAGQVLKVNSGATALE